MPYDEDRSPVRSVGAGAGVGGGTASGADVGTSLDEQVDSNAIVTKSNVGPNKRWGNCRARCHLALPNLAAIRAQGNTRPALGFKVAFCLTSVPLSPELGKMMVVDFQHFIEHGLHPVGSRAKRVGQQRLVGGPAVAVHCRLNSQ
jgi:hypothetical protein